MQNETSRLHFTVNGTYSIPEEDSINIKQYIRGLRNSSILDSCIGIVSVATEGHAGLPVVEFGIHIVGGEEGAVTRYITSVA